MQSLDAPLLDSLPPISRSCGQCGLRNGPGRRFCEACGSPFDNLEFDLFHAPALRDARRWMGCVALLYVLSGALSALTSKGAGIETLVGTLIVYGALALTQGGLWWWAQRSVFPAAV